MNTNENATIYESIPMVSELNKVQGFDPLKFLRKTRKGEKKLDLKYKKLWFRLKYPNGRIKLSALKITDQLAIIEARVYFDKSDIQPKSSFIAQREAKSTPGGLYIESAQHAAIDQALSDAGFGIQFTSVAPNQSIDAEVKAAKDQSVVAEAVPVTEEQPVAKAESITETEKERVWENPAMETVAVKEHISDQLAAPTEASAEAAVEAVIEIAEEAEGEEVEEEVSVAFSASASYTSDMPVEEICSMMTKEDAGNVIVPIGTCKGWTLSQVADRRPASLKWYINGYSGDDNILRAAATIMQSTLEIQKAS